VIYSEALAAPAATLTDLGVAVEILDECGRRHNVVQEITYFSRHLNYARKL